MEKSPFLISGNIKSCLHCLSIQCTKQSYQRTEQNTESFFVEWQKKKIKHDTLCNSFETGGLQSVDIEIKIKALQLLWVHRFFDQKEHQWKSIPRFLLRKNFGDVNIFYPHFSPDKEALKSFPIFYQLILTAWKECSKPR